MADMNLIDRRRLLQAMAFGACGMSVSGWLPALADQLQRTRVGAGTVFCCGWLAVRARPIRGT